MAWDAQVAAAKAMAGTEIDLIGVALVAKLKCEHAERKEAAERDARAAA